MVEKRRRRRVNKKAVGILVVLLLLLVGAGACLWRMVLPSKPEGAAVSTEPAAAAGKYNILILGIDKRRDDIGRSNVTCLMTVDLAQKSVSMLWIPRDSRVDIPGYEWNKIGHAYAYGGPALSEKTVSKLLGVPVDYYLAVNMEGFKHVIDAIGGIDLQVDKAMHYYDPYDEGEVDNNGLIDLKPGLQHMDGNTALEYVRFRHDEMGDIGRIGRQEKFVKALLDAVEQPAVLAKIPDIVKQVKLSLDTDVPVSVMAKIAAAVPFVHKEGLHTDMVAGTPVYIDNISYWLPDIEAMRTKAIDMEGLAATSDYEADTKRMAADYKRSTAHLKVEIAK